MVGHCSINSRLFGWFAWVLLGGCYVLSDCQDVARQLSIAGWLLG